MKLKQFLEIEFHNNLFLLKNINVNVSIIIITIIKKYYNKTIQKNLYLNNNEYPYPI